MEEDEDYLKKMKFLKYYRYFFGWTITTCLGVAIGTAIHTLIELFK